MAGDRERYKNNGAVGKKLEKLREKIENQRKCIHWKDKKIKVLCVNAESNELTERLFSRKQIGNDSFSGGTR